MATVEEILVPDIGDFAGVEVIEILVQPGDSIQAEQSLLGALMQGGTAWERVADQVKEGDFYRREHRSIFSAVKSLAEGDEPCDLVTVTETLERRDELDEAGLAPSHIVFTSSSGGTHAGLLAGRAAAAHGGRRVPDVVAIGVAKGVNLGLPDVAELANHTLTLMGSTAIVAHEDVEVDTRRIGPDYAVPTDAGDDAIRWAATHGGWLLDRTYSGKGCSGLLGLAAEGRFGDDVVFIHTGGWPALFAPGGRPPLPG